MRIVVLYFNTKSIVQRATHTIFAKLLITDTVLRQRALFFTYSRLSRAARQAIT